MDPPWIPSTNPLPGKVAGWLELQQPSCAILSEVHTMTWKEACTLTIGDSPLPDYLQIILCKRDINLYPIQGIVFPAVVCAGKLNAN